VDTYSPAIYRGDVPQLRYARAREVKSWQDLNQVPVVYGFNQQSHHAVAVTPASRRGGAAGTSNKLTHVGNSTVFGSDRKGVESTRRSREHVPYSSLRQGCTASAWGILSNSEWNGLSASSGVGRVNVT
jgi:hypothetical protein